MEKILDLRFLSQDIIESKLDEEGNSKSYIVDRSNGKEYEIQLYKDKQLKYNEDENMKILNFESVEKINNMPENLDIYTIILFHKDNKSDDYNFYSIDNRGNIYLNRELINIPKNFMSSNFIKIKKILKVIKKITLLIDKNILKNFKNISSYHDIKKNISKIQDYQGFYNKFLKGIKNIITDFYIDDMSIPNNQEFTNDFLTKIKNIINEVDDITSIKYIYNLQIYNQILSEEKMMEIYEELQKDVNIHRQKELEMTDRKLKLLIQYNETNKEIERLTNNKEKILEKANKHDKILKARELVRQRVEFNKKWIHYLMTTSKVVHIILVIIIIVMIIYKVY
tara:strand:+ start:163 stop:1179 length:1017 start_codon:yes stop_codon:yes gene_type:complete